MGKVYIIDGVRTPVGSFQGSLMSISAVELAQLTITALLERNKVSPGLVDEVIIGNVLQAGSGQNIARQAAVNSGIPVDKTAVTVNMVCGSGMRSACMGSQSIICGDADIVVAGGTENMTQAPYLLKDARNGCRLGNKELTDSMIADGLWDAFNDYHMGVTAENISERYQISREQQDKFACGSQNKAARAIEAKRFADEIIPVEVPVRKKAPIIFDQDEYPKPGTTVGALAELKPAFKRDGTVTAGNASGINDGAAMLLLCGENAVDKYKLKPAAGIVSYAYCGVDPSVMGIAPVDAVKKALRKAEWEIEDIGLIESNEAFAAQSLAVIKELNLNPDIVNVNGGAIALGHPIGASGTRILVTLLHEMKKRQVSRGLATLCIGGGMGIAMCIENIK